MPEHMPEHVTSSHVLALASEIEALRELYTVATPSQRWSVVLQRINNPASYPNELVTRVSAIEAFARSLVANFNSPNKEAILAKHRKLAKRDATSLVDAYTKLRATSPKELFGEELWEVFRVAVSARNLLVHECTYLDVQKYLPMENACTEVLFGLVKLSEAKMSAPAV